MNQISRFTRHFLHHLYHELALFYDLVAYAVSLGNWQTWITSVLPFITGPIVLETGFGPGHLLNRLNQQGYRVFGLDESQQMARMAQKQFLKQRHDERPLRLPGIVIGRTQNIPFPDNFFDTIVATFPTTYIYHLDTIMEFHRVLKPGASLIVLLSAETPETSFQSKTSRWLFKITGQDATPNHISADIFAPDQFTIQTKWMNIPSGRVFILEATKLPGLVTDFSPFW